jgi:hypothetical protein
MQSISIRKTGNTFLIILVITFLAYIFTGCTTSKKSPPTYNGAYANMYNAIYKNLFFNIHIKDNNWPADWGDASGYGPAFIYAKARNGESIKNEMEIADGNLKMVAELIYDFTPADILTMDINKLQDIFLGVLGLIHGYVYSHSEQYSDAIREFLDTVNNFVGNDISFILTLNIPGYDPAITMGMLAYYNIFFGLNVNGGEPYAEYGLSIISQMEQKVYDAGDHYYHPNLTSSDFWIYPNIMMILALSSAYEYTGNNQYIQKAELIYNTIKKITFNEENGGYNAPDEANPEVEYLLSIQTYMVMVDILLYDLTGKNEYIDNAKFVLDFIQNNLFSEIAAYHHTGTDGLSHFYCTGCNLQLLYDIYEFNRRIK